MTEEIQSVDAAPAAPKNPNAKVRTSITLRPDLFEKAKQVSAAKGQSVSALIEAALLVALS